ncbi:acyltransferase [Bacteroides sp. 224]|uniref:LpxL/LpxP family acyltransferase n=1 Tax=Bacteroides sp. 224 TaxID=2302936 RepID=UPI0013D19B60|nr:acyltransferase [Bacteroides sp. 224]NDV64319.1 acyltransferase [Bacteroides sp. 224]
MWKGKTRGGAFGYLFFIYLIRYAGVTAAYAFLCLVVPYFIPFAPKATASIWFYGRRILKYNPIRCVGLLFRNYYRLGQILIDKVAISNGFTKKYQFKFGNYKEFLDILNGDKGVVMIGAHVGNWEIGAPFFDDYGKKINIVMYDAEHRKIKEILEKNGVEKNYKFIPVNEDDLTHVFKITEALAQKEYVCFQGDRFVNTDKLLSCSFMGKEAYFPAGPFLLAARMKVPVVFYFAMREPKRTYHFHFIVAEEVKRTKDKKPEQMLLEQYTTTLEKIMKQYPEQWFNYYRFWDSLSPTLSKVEGEIPCGENL